MLFINLSGAKHSARPERTLILNTTIKSYTVLPSPRRPTRKAKSDSATCISHFTRLSRHAHAIVALQKALTARITLAVTIAVPDKTTPTHFSVAQRELGRPGLSAQAPCTITTDKICPADCRERSWCRVYECDYGLMKERSCPN